MGMIDKRNDTQVCALQTLTLSGTTPAATSLVDMQGFAACTFFVGTGTVTDAGDANGFSFEVQHSDTTAAAAFTAVADEDLTNLESTLTVTLDTADNVAVGSIGYVGTKRYVRLVATGTTGTNAAALVAPVKGSPTVAPPSATQAVLAAT
jgi:hypothetical protein